MVDLIIKVVVWCTWLERNARIFNAYFASADAIISKIDHLLLSWFFTASKASKGHLEVPIASVHHNLLLKEPRTVVSTTVTQTSEVDPILLEE